MKKTLCKISLLIVSIALFSACAKAPESKTAAAPSGSHVTISLIYNKQTGMASNQYAIWVEDQEGNYIKTIYATNFTTKNFAKRPDSLSTWTAKAKITDMDAKQIDAFTAPTPASGVQTYTWDLTDQKGQKVPDGNYSILIEVALFWKNKIIYQAEISTKDTTPQTAKIKQQNLYTENKNLDMIKDVKITFVPKNK